MLAGRSSFMLRAARRVTRLPSALMFVATWIVASPLAAQTAPPASPPATASAAAAPATAPSPAGRAAGDSSAPAAAPSPPPRPATGYAPASTPRKGVVRLGSGKGTKRVTKARVDRKAQSGAFVVEPGFELLEGGGSRFFVELGQAVPVEQRKAKGAMTFVLKGARNAFRNNENPLVTEHFNTPVRRAKLVPSGKDLLFVFDLREDVGATQRVVTTNEGHAMVQIDFGPGSFVKEDQADSVPESGDARDPRTKRRTPRMPPQDGVAPASGAKPEEPKGAGPTP